VALACGRSCRSTVAGSRGHWRRPSSHALGTLLWRPAGGWSTRTRALASRSLCSRAAGGGRREVGFDVLVGADGIRSAARTVVLGQPVPFRYAGATVWRGVTRFPGFADGATMVIAGDGQNKVVFYPLTDRDNDGRVLMNWAAATSDGGESDERGNWNTAAQTEHFAGEFTGWRVSGVDIGGLMLATERPFAYPMVDIDPLPTWTRGSVVLIGDAAHAMYPIGSNGATQSVIDAAALANHLKPGAPVSDALEGYEAERRPATAEVQTANRAQGPEVVIDLAAQRAPDGFTDLAEVFAPGELERIASRYAAVSGATTQIRRR
jgi:5-methylphenazine-1-carboxylate 1-monooxygenase